MSKMPFNNANRLATSIQNTTVETQSDDEASKLIEWSGGREGNNDECMGEKKQATTKEMGYYDSSRLMRSIYREYELARSSCGLRNSIIGRSSNDCLPATTPRLNPFKLFIIVTAAAQLQSFCNDRETKFGIQGASLRQLLISCCILPLLQPPQYSHLQVAVSSTLYRSLFNFARIFLQITGKQGKFDSRCQGILQDTHSPTRTIFFEAKKMSEFIYYLILVTSTKFDEQEKFSRGSVPPLNCLEEIYNLINLTSRSECFGTVRTNQISYTSLALNKSIWLDNVMKYISDCLSTSEVESGVRRNVGSNHCSGDGAISYLRWMNILPSIVSETQAVFTRDATFRHSHRFHHLDFVNTTVSEREKPRFRGSGKEVFFRQYIKISLNPDQESFPTDSLAYKKNLTLDDLTQSFVVNKNTPAMLCPTTSNVLKHSDMKSQIERNGFNYPRSTNLSVDDKYFIANGCLKDSTIQSSIVSPSNALNTGLDYNVNQKHSSSLVPYALGFQIHDPQFQTKSASAFCTVAQRSANASELSDGQMQHRLKRRHKSQKTTLTKHDKIKRRKMRKERKLMKTTIDSTCDQVCINEFTVQSPFDRMPESKRTNLSSEIPSGEATETVKDEAMLQSSVQHQIATYCARRGTSPRHDSLSYSIQYDDVTQAIVHPSASLNECRHERATIIAKMNDRNQKHQRDMLGDPRLHDEPHNDSLMCDLKPAPTVPKPQNDATPATKDIIYIPSFSNGSWRQQPESGDIQSRLDMDQITCKLQERANAISPNSPQKESSTVELFCSVDFFERWNFVVNDLASGLWVEQSGLRAEQTKVAEESPEASISKPSLKIKLIDIRLVDFCGVSIELPGRGGIVVLLTSSLHNLHFFKGLVVNVANLVAINRYRYLFFVLCVDIEITETVSANIVRLQCSVTSNVKVETQVSFKYASIASLSYSIGSTISTYLSADLVHGSGSWNLILSASNDTTACQRVHFLLSLLPTLNVAGAFECLLVCEEQMPNASSFWMLFQNQLLRDRIQLHASSTAQGCEIHPMAMAQLALVLSVFI